MATLKELSIASGVQEIAPGRTVGEQVYDSSINTVSQDTDLGSDTYTGSITPYSDNVDPFFSGLHNILILFSSSSFSSFAFMICSSRSRFSRLASNWADFEQDSTPSLSATHT